MNKQEKHNTHINNKRKIKHSKRQTRKTHNVNKEENNNYKLTNLILNPVKQLYVSYVKTASLRQAQEFEKALISFLKPKGNTLLKNNGGTYG